MSGKRKPIWPGPDDRDFGRFRVSLSHYPSTWSELIWADPRSLFVEIGKMGDRVWIVAGELSRILVLFSITLSYAASRLPMECSHERCFLARSSPYSPIRLRSS